MDLVKLMAVPNLNLAFVVYSDTVLVYWKTLIFIGQDIKAFEGLVIQVIGIREGNIGHIWESEGYLLEIQFAWIDARITIVWRRTKLWIIFDFEVVGGNKLRVIFPEFVHVGNVLKGGLANRNKIFLNNKWFIVHMGIAIFALAPYSLFPIFCVQILRKALHWGLISSHSK